MAKRNVAWNASFTMRIAQLLSSLGERSVQLAVREFRHSCRPLSLVFFEMMFSVNDQVADFVAEARRFCTLVESEGNEATTFEEECLAVLLRLYQRLLLLPRVDPIEFESPERIPHEEWQTVRERTAHRINSDQYWEVFEPFAEKKPEPIYGSISDDLADIWRDLKMGLSALDTGKPNCVESAVWHWRFGFGSHWGYHVAGAIRALTALHAAEFC